VLSISVSIQEGRPENVGIVFEIVNISQSTSEISQVTAAFDATPDTAGCQCLPAEVYSVSVCVKESRPEKVTLVFEIMSISQCTSEISQVPVSFDHLSSHTRLPMSASGSS